MSAKCFLFIWLVCYIESTVLNESNGIQSCNYSDGSVVFLCSTASEDDLSFFSEIEYTNCKGLKISFERSKVGKVSFRGCVRKGLPTNLFSVYTGMQTLNVTDMSLAEIPSDFDKLTKLTNLLASHNKLSTIPKLPNDIETIDLSHNKISNCGSFEITAKLSDLNFAFNSIQKLCFSEISQNLTILNLTHNQINEIPEILFANAIKLHTIDLSHNNLITMKVMNVVETNQVKVIHLNDNKISHLDANVFENFVNLEKLVLSNNRLIIKANSQTKIKLQSLMNLIELDISSNEFEELDNQMFPLNSKLKILKMKNIKLKEVNFENVPNLEYLDISNNDIQQLSEDVFESLTSLEYLDLSHNAILRKVPGNMFKRLKRLKHANLSHIDVSEIPLKTFSSQSDSLESLDLSGNPIASLSDEIFATEMNQLKTLVIRSCHMNVLNGFRVQSFPQLKIIGVDKNNVFNCTVLEMVTVALDSDRCPIEYWNGDKITIWCLAAVNIILIVIIIGGIVWFKLRQRRIDPSFNLCHDYRQNFGYNSRTATVKSRHRPPKTTLTEENNYEIPDAYDHLKF